MWTKTENTTHYIFPNVKKEDYMKKNVNRFFFCVLDLEGNCSRLCSPLL